MGRLTQAANGHNWPTGRTKVATVAFIHNFVVYPLPAQILPNANHAVLFFHAMRPRSLLLLTTVAVVAIWQLPYGRQILYPLLLAGCKFEQLVLHADGSGLAVWSGSPGRMATAFVAAGGLVGPTVAGVLMLLLSGTPRWSRGVLAALSALLVVCVVLWSGNAFGAVYLLAMATAFGLAARFFSDFLASFLVHLLAVTLCLSWFSNLGYLFSSHAVVDGVSHLSDSAVIAQALWLPYWFWGGLIAVFSLTGVLFGVWFSGRSAPRQG